MENIRITYTELKQKIANGEPYISFFSKGSRRVHCFSGGIEYFCKVKISDEPEYISLYGPNEDKNAGQKTSPFADKQGVRFNGQGKQFTNVAAETDGTFILDYDITELCRFTGLEIFKGIPDDFAELKIVTTANKAIVLNQFGTGWNISTGHYEFNLPYDAELNVGATIRIVYHSNDMQLSRNINYVLHGVV